MHTKTHLDREHNITRNIIHLFLEDQSRAINPVRLCSYNVSAMCGCVSRDKSMTEKELECVCVCIYIYIYIYTFNPVVIKYLYSVIISVSSQGVYV
jgi:hypothetical protein